MPIAPECASCPSLSIGIRGVSFVESLRTAGDRIKLLRDDIAEHSAESRAAFDWVVKFTHIGDGCFSASPSRASSLGQRSRRRLDARTRSVRFGPNRIAHINVHVKSNHGSRAWPRDPKSPSLKGIESPNKSTPGTQ